MLGFRWQFTFLVLLYEFFTSIYAINFVLSLSNLKPNQNDSYGEIQFLSSGKGNGYETVVENVNETKSTNDSLDATDETHFIEIHLLNNETQSLNISEGSQKNLTVNYIDINSTNETQFDLSTNTTNTTTQKPNFKMENSTIQSANDNINLKQTNLTLETQMNTTEINLINHLPTIKEIYTVGELMKNNSLENETDSYQWDNDVTNITELSIDEYTTTEILTTTVVDDIEATELYNLTTLETNSNSTLEHKEFHSTQNIWNIIMPVTSDNKTDPKLDEGIPGPDQGNSSSEGSEANFKSLSGNDKQNSSLSTPDKILQELIDNFFTPVISESNPSSSTTEIPNKTAEEGESEGGADSLLASRFGGGYRADQKNGLLQETGEGWLTSAQLTNDFLIAYRDG